MSNLELELEKAIKIALEAHAGQMDKAGQPYILHPLAVMGMVATTAEKIVAVLHDVIEDTDVTMLILRGALAVGEEIFEAIEAITKRKNKESYLEYMNRVRASKIATIVKLADMAHNTDPDRISYLSIQKQLRLVAKYARGRHYLKTGEWHSTRQLEELIRAGYRQ
jgi:(p)ppGpp synthase/HD superfamily hydrolase